MRFIYHLSFFIFLSLTSCSLGQEKQNAKIGDLSFDKICIGLMENSITWNEAVKLELIEKWETGSVPIVLEMARFNRGSVIEELFKMMIIETEQSFDTVKEWENWLWKQEYKPLAGYPEFKSKLYSQIDPRFADYYKNGAKSTIRLDEVVWGGVRKDGIPPLRDPKMISVSKAKYLDDNDIVFGIEVNGEARAYPKRILAWHEMFTDTIQGIPLAGVY